MKNRFKTEIDFDADYVLELFHKQEGLCGYFKIPMIPSGKRTHPFRPSLDRIDNDKGYLKDNIVLCTIMANLGRQSCPYDEWIECLDGLEIKKKCSMQVAKDVDRPKPVCDSRDMNMSIEQIKEVNRAVNEWYTNDEIF